MEAINLSKVDLNLLVSLSILLEECSVSRAAEKLHITQPAMSKTLSRLRYVFDDPLFTRRGHQMLPTPRAIEISQDLQDILGDISHLISAPQFDPRAFNGEISIVLSEYIGLTLLPNLVSKLSSQAPKLKLRVITRVENQLEELARGNLDFAIHIKQAAYSDEFEVEEIGSSPPAILVRQSHPLTKMTLTPDKLLTYPLIRLYISDLEQIDTQPASDSIATLQNHPSGSLEISHLLTALEILRHADYFMPAPAHILQNARATSDIVGLPVPRGTNLALDYCLVRHTRTSNSAAHNWLWDQITCTIRELRTPPQRKLRQRITASKH